MQRTLSSRDLLRLLLIRQSDSDATDMDAFMAEAWNEDASKTVKDALTEKIAVIGENLNIRRFEKVVD